MKTIDITNIWDDDDMVELSIRMSNGETSCKLVFYADDETFLEFGNALVDFPKNTNHIVQYKSGDWENSSHYILLEVFCVAPNGASAMKVVAKNFFTAPNSFKATFYIQTEPANFNAFGKALKK
ncbi:hypothetical protein [Spirosoma sordidisoli]|uniref:Uncharacterized protein n=1 Tax=Spirosoma sordidisoli TaxID=2502893 RepID=A0A4Q2UX90_9BACT|nr:hypothetical protein [Spirosoma sordidisoli]RYC71659.1 hypothetical protein EQG79_05875 [Spirosoma sordidisoli]